jgi:hypothetical protein
MPLKMMAMIDGMLLSLVINSNHWGLDVANKRDCSFSLKPVLGIAALEPERSPDRLLSSFLIQQLQIVH